MTDEDRKDALDAEVAAIDARLRQIAASDRTLERLRDDPEVRGRLEAYAEEFGGGDPTWWKPELELVAAGPSDRAEQVVAPAPRGLRELSDVIARAVKGRSGAEREQLSRETGIALAELDALEESAPGGGPSRVAIEIARQIHAITRACATYGLAPEEFEHLEEGPADKKAGTLVGRRPRPEPKSYRVAKKSLTGTARLDVPAEVASMRGSAREAGVATAGAVEPAHSARRAHRRLVAVLGVVIVVTAVVVAWRRGGCAGAEGPSPAEAPGETAPAMTETPARAGSPAVLATTTMPPPSSASIEVGPAASTPPVASVAPRPRPRASTPATAAAPPAPPPSAGSATVAPLPSATEPPPPRPEIPFE